MSSHKEAPPPYEQTASEKPKPSSLKAYFEDRKTLLVQDVVQRCIEPVVRDTLLGARWNATIILVPATSNLPAHLLIDNIVTPKAPTLGRSWKLEQHESEILEDVSGIEELVHETAKCFGNVAGIKVQTQNSSKPSDSPADLGIEVRQNRGSKERSDRQRRDPTGTTGSWNLGWKEDNHTPIAEHAHEVFVVRAFLKEVAFRFENELGLYDSASAKCLWLEIEIRRDSQ